MTEYVYLGAVLGTKLTPTKHLSRLRNNMVIATNSLATKVNLRKTNLDTATRLFNAIIVKSGTYGMIVYPQISEQQITNHQRYAYSVFYKRWAGIERRMPTMPLMRGLSSMTSSIFDWQMKARNQ